MYNKRESLTGKGGVCLENILNYLDDLFSHFPWNRKSSQLKSQLKDAMYTDYQNLLDQNVKPDVAFEQVKEKVAEPERIAAYIPNSFFDFHTLLLCLNIIIFGILYYFTNNPNFLQIFLPVRLEFPTIIARLIQLTVLCPMMGLIVYHFYKFLPSKFLTRTYWQSCLFIFLAAVLYALYFASSIVFIWYTLSGYDPVILEHQPITALLYFIYQNIILKPIWMWIYSFLIGTFFIASRQLYHCPRKVQDFSLNDIYHASFVNVTFDDEITVPLQQPNSVPAARKPLTVPVHLAVSAMKSRVASRKTKKPTQTSEKPKKAEAKPVEIIEKEPFQKEKSVSAVSSKPPKVNKPRTKNHANRKRPQMINAKKQKITLKQYGPKNHSS